MECLFCATEMVAGALAMNGRSLVWATVVWEPDERGKGASVLRPGFLGLRTRPTLRCPACGALVSPPVPLADDPDRPAVSRRARREAVRPSESAPAPSWEAMGERTDDDPLRP